MSSFAEIRQEVWLANVQLPKAGLVTMHSGNASGVHRGGITLSSPMSGKLLLILCIVFAIGIGIILFLKLNMYRSISYTLISDVASFTQDNGGRMPRNWSEFVAWSKKQPTQKWYSPEKLERRFMLTQAPLQGSNMPLIIVLDPVLKDQEDYFNKELRRLIKNRLAGGGRAVVPQTK